jgi:hypothetical protein
LHHYDEQVPTPCAALIPFLLCISPAAVAAAISFFLTIVTQNNNTISVRSLRAHFRRRKRAWWRDAILNSA